MDIYLTAKSGERIQFPMIPERVAIAIESRFQSYDIMDIGEIRIPKGEKLTTVSWEGVFPGSHQKKASYIRGVWRSPRSLVSAIERLRLSQEKCTLLITETPVNREVYIESFHPDQEGGDINTRYTISFCDAKDLVISTEAPAVGASNKTQETKRPAESNGKTYTVKAGDCLWDIAEKMGLGGANYEKLYDANKDVIAPRNQQHKMPKYTIYPGQVFIIP